MNWRLQLRRQASGPEGRPGSGETGRDKAPSRRKVIERVAGLAAGGAAANWLMSGSKAYAATSAATVESGAVAPAVVALADAATISVDASAGNDFRVTIAGNRALSNPANPVDGQQVIFQVTQGSGGSFALSFGSAYEFSTSIPQPTLSSTAGHTDLLGFIYNAAKGTWLLAAYVNGFS